MNDLIYLAPKLPEIAFAERRPNGIVIAFVDGSAALYPASLLYENLPLAQTLVGSAKS